MDKYLYQGEGRGGIEYLASRYDVSVLLDLYYRMLRIRLIEEMIAKKYSEEHMKTPIHLAIGQEATAVGTCTMLRKTDLVFCGHRTHAIYLAKGGNLFTMLSELYGRANGCAGSRGGSMHLLDKEAGMAGSSAIVAGVIPIATGVALNAKLKNQNYLTAVYFGDAAAEEGALWESLNFAVLKQLPIIYICENNYYSVCSPIGKRQPKGIEIYKKAEAFGAYSQSIDGCNVLAIYEAMQRAITSARDRKKPAFIESHAYRFRSHHGPEEDNELCYRSMEELDHWRLYDPVLILKKILEEKYKIDNTVFDEFDQKISEEMMQAFIHAEHSINPAEADLLTNVYSD